MADLPNGTVTFLFTDVEASTRLWEQHPGAMKVATARHDAIVEEQVMQHGGVMVRPRGEGDSRFAVFARASAAVAAAAALQAALHAEPWPTPTPLRVRMALHTGEADLREGDYYGAAVNRCARLRAIAHGGQVLLSQTTCDLVRQALPAGVSLRDLGQHRLADLTLPERVFQVTLPALPADFRPLTSLDAFPNNLPLQLSSFVGRERAIAEVKGRLDTTRLLTLTGTGGCGKTRLALQVAADLVAAYPDGVWLVELAPLADAALVPDAVAAALGVRGGPGQPIRATLLSFLRLRRLLVILDNCEHLLDACAHLADAVLRSCPNVQILATSREALGITGELSWHVPSLALPPADQEASLAALAGSEAIQLFVERADAVQPGFTLAERSAPTVAQICRRLDGIPLAIELAATRVGALPIEQIAARLDQRFRLLTGGSRTALPRQQTLAALVGWSYDLLTEPERTLFNHLSVFAGGFTLDAAEAVCGNGEQGPAAHPLPSPVAPEDVLDLLSELVDKSLVVADSGAGGVERYRLLETLRQYGRERLVGAGEDEILYRRHAAYYLQLAVEAEPHLIQPEQLAYLARLDLERDNLRAALRWFLDREEADKGLLLMEALKQYWWYRALWSEGGAWQRQFFHLPGPVTPSPARARALAWAGATATATSASAGDLAGGRDLLLEALAMARQLGDDRALAEVMLLASRGGGPDKEQWYHLTDRGLAEGALAHYRAAGDRRGIAEALIELSRQAFYQGDSDQACRIIAEGLAAARTLGDRWIIALALEVSGQVVSAPDDQEAGAHLRESLRLYRELGDLIGIASVESLLGRLDRLHGRTASAREHYRTSLRLTRDSSILGLVATSLDGLALVSAAEGEAEEALLLAGASANLPKEPAWLASPIEQAELDRALVALRPGPGEKDAAWAAGRAMTLEQAVAYALGEDTDA